MLSITGPAVTAGEVDAAMAAHPAFTSGGEDGYILGRPAKVSAITGGIRPADLESGAPPRPAKPASIGQLAQATVP